MRVLHIVSNISLRSGIMSFIMNYGRYLSGDVKFDFLYYEEREFEHKNEIALLGGCAYKTPSPTSIRAYSAYIKDFCEQHRGEYDVIHLHDSFLILFYSSLKRRLGAKSFIVHAHNTKFSDNPRGELRNRLFSIPNKWLPDYRCACSEMAGEVIFGKRFIDQGHVIKNAIMLRKFLNNPMKREAKRRELGVDSSFVVGHIGNFIQQKNHDYVIKVFSEVAKKRSDAVLVLIGDGILRPEIEDQCVKLGIREKVHFLGVRNDVCEIMCAFDRFLFPSLYEGLGIVLIEAQSAGIPCIYSSAVPSETNILKANNRILDLQKPAVEWANAVMDEKLSVMFNTEQEIRNAGFDIETEAIKLKNLYQALVETEDEKV